jgi:hypothetical protein
MEAHELERLRRSIAMLRPGQPAGLTRKRAIQLLGELERLQQSDRRYSDLLARLRALLDEPVVEHEWLSTEYHPATSCTRDRAIGNV